MKTLGLVRRCFTRSLSSSITSSLSKSGSELFPLHGLSGSHVTKLLRRDILSDQRRPFSSSAGGVDYVDINSSKEHELRPESSVAANGGLRLSKMIAETGICSRREAEKRISEQRVSVNGRIVTDPWHRISPDAQVWMDEYRLRLNKTYDAVQLWAVNKLRGELVADSDPVKQRPLLFDRLEKLLKEEPNLRPITRLEFNTEGLLLLTNNGRLAKMLESSESGMERTFQVKVHGLLTESKLEGLKRGLIVKGVKYSSMDCVVDSRGNTNAWLTVRCTDYKSRQIQTCFESLFLKVLRVVCTGYGPFDLKTIPAGGFAQLALPPKIQKLFYGRSSGMASGMDSSTSASRASQPTRPKVKPNAESEVLFGEEKKLLLDALNSNTDIEFVDGVPVASSTFDGASAAAPALMTTRTTENSPKIAKTNDSSGHIEKEDKQMKLKRSILRILKRKDP